MAAKLKLLQIGKALINYSVMTESAGKLLSLEVLQMIESSLTSN